MSQRRKRYLLKVVPAFTIWDLMRELKEFRPDVVLFSGHGASYEGLVCEDESGDIKLLPTAALADLFKTADYVRCVVLNACSSEIQAAAIGKHIRYVVGMRGKISDRAAIAYEGGFCTSLFAGEPFEVCHESGKVAIALMGIPEDSIPVLIINKSARPSHQAATSPLSKGVSLELKSTHAGTGVKPVTSKRPPGAAAPDIPLAITDGWPTPVQTGRRSFVMKSLAGVGCAVGGFGLRELVVPTYPLDGFYLQEGFVPVGGSEMQEGFQPAKSLEDTGFLVEAYECEVVVFHENGLYTVVERTHIRLMLERLGRQVIGGYDSTFEWHESERINSTTISTLIRSPDISRGVLKDLRFDQFASHEDVKNFKLAKDLLEATYGPNRTSKWEWKDSKLKRTIEGLPKNIFRRRGEREWRITNR